MFALGSFLLGPTGLSLPMTPCMCRYVVCLPWAMTLMVTMDSKMALVTSLHLFTKLSPVSEVFWSGNPAFLWHFQHSTLLGPHPGASSVVATLGGGIRWWERQNQRERAIEHRVCVCTYACVSACIGNPEVSFMQFSGTTTLILSQELSLA